jgi:anti-sigma regulatory factor (Ser/Thr protein kinase)
MLNWRARRDIEPQDRVPAQGSDMPETVLTLDRTMDAPRQARDRVRQLPHLGADHVEDAVLLVSELVTNAVKYGPEHEAIRLIITTDDRATRFTVHDLGLGPLPEMREAGDPAPGGHGLRLVDALADRWGVERGSTRVWFELAR